MTIDLMTTIQRKFGLSSEDSDRVIKLVAEETMQRHMDAQSSAPPPVPEPSNPAPIVVNVYVDEQVREGIVVDVAKAINAGLSSRDADRQRKRSVEV